MRIEVTDDLELIASLMEHPDLYNRITDDHSYGLRGEKLIQHLEDNKRHTLYLKVSHENEVVGFFECSEIEDGSLDMHPNMLKKARGPLALKAGEMVRDMLFKYTSYSRLVAKVPSKYLEVLKYATKIGFKLDHMVEKAFIKNNVEYDMYYLSLEKGVK
jgi:hypothetical protein